MMNIMVMEERKRHFVSRLISHGWALKYFRNVWLKGTRKVRDDWRQTIQREMGEIIRDWLRTRLGVIIELSPEVFGHYAKDGTLLAKVLHSYDVINDSQLSTLLETQDPALARVNLKHLRVWLRFVGVDCDNDCIEDISNGKGTMALRLFYKVFLCLENKDRLHFITLQKEREKYIPSCSKFDVTVVSEEPLTWQSRDQLFTDSLKKSASLIDWRKKKYQDLVDGSKKRFDKFRSSQKVNEILESLQTCSNKKKSSVGKKGELFSTPEVSRELDEFAKKHRVKKSPEPGASDPCEDIFQSDMKETSRAPMIDPDAARAYTKALRNKHRQEALTKSFKTRMQMNLLAELWKKVLDDQEMEFDEIIAKKVLHQSQYEKQLVRKLCEVRSEKSRMATNRMIVEKLMENTRESELRLEQERAREVMVRENEEVEAERRRINELERKIEEQTKFKKEAQLAKFGERIVLDLVDMAIKTGEYRRESNEIQVPDVLLNQWKALFLKSQPIIEVSSQLFTKDDLEADEETREESLVEDNDARTRILNDEDFKNYLHMKLPWKDFLPNVDQEVADYLNLGLVVLGYIVHKTLESLYPRDQSDLVESSLPAMRTRAVVLGIPDSLLYEPIQQLLENSKIQLVRLEEAINYCLGAYKAEMRDFEYIDLEIIAATREVVGSSSIPSEDTTSGKKGRKDEKSSLGKRKTAASSIEKLEITRTGVDKVTQTPRVIPHEDKDPSLGNAAYIGKWIHEFLTLGEPLSDDLISRTIVEYLKGASEERIEGFVLVNYPNTYHQMSSLEYALSGKILPERLRKTSDKMENTNVEEIASIVSRITFEEDDNDSESSRFESRLVPNPAKPQCTLGRSCLTGFVRIKPKPDVSMENYGIGVDDDDDIWEILSENANAVDEFYADQEIASILYYTIFDLATLKKLVRLVIAEKNELISRIPSQELFGDHLNYFEGRSNDSSTSRAPIVKRLLKWTAGESSLGESRSSDSVESRQIEMPFRRSKIGSQPLPGEIMWPWSNIPQPLQFLQSLANLWKKLETRYIENLKEIFHLKRMNFGGIVPYKDFVMRHMMEFIDRPDKKQDCLHQFHRAFNDIDDQIRDNVDVKKELHCRIDDFQTKLWDICDSRRREAQDERMRIIMEHWLTLEMINVSNVYIDILQAEIDRCSDTLQFINDYYTSALQRPLVDVRFSPTLRKILLVDETSDSRHETVLVENDSTKNHRGRDRSKDPSMKISLPNISEAPSPPTEELFKEETLKVLVHGNREPFYPAQTLSYKAIEANIRYVEKILESLASRILDNLKKEESSDVRSSSRKASGSRKSGQEIENKQSQNLFLEWRYAFMYEINRIRVRLKMLDASSRHDINYLIDAVRRVFSDIQNNILERYNREIKSVDEMATVFRFAVEEATPIQEELLLDADRFIVRSNVLMFPDGPQVTHRRHRRSSIRQHSLPSRFTIPMLSRLVEIFRRAAPSGIMSERSFVYILQDLLVFETNGDGALPSYWSKLRACEVGRLVNELFGNEDSIDWREFIIYATDIEMPSVDEILNDLRSLRRIDDKAQEFVSRQDFLSIRLWFCANRENPARVDLSDGSLQRYTESEEDGIAPMKLGRHSDLQNNWDIKENEMNPDEALRPEMLKQLLCDVFSYDNEKVNYVAFLMAFCKDEKPEVGFGKALCLAIGDKVCIDWEEGERYVREFIEDQRRSISTKSTGSDNRCEATLVSTAVLDHLLESVFRLAAPNFGESVKNNDPWPTEENRNSRHRLMTIENTSPSGKSFVAENVRLSESKVSISVHSEDTERKNRGLSVTISVPEKENESGKASQSTENVAVHWLHLQVFHSVFAAVLQSHAAQENLLGSGRSLYENLELVYHELGGKETTDDPEVMILSHKFIHHEFVKKLLADSSKFTTKHLGNIIKEIMTHR
ncbi:sperm flagellar protein 2-like [Venturia canescens]|uniref:sperm flagellar protein 2-like n=1 Tax=Venturia canescens TaxID=32260 RepID=UPI001C9C4C90|nr:sperm flagellar protein 2-like [Venturia canescens]